MTTFRFNVEFNQDEDADILRVLNNLDDAGQAELVKDGLRLYIKEASIDQETGKIRETPESKKMLDKLLGIE